MGRAGRIGEQLRRHSLADPGSRSDLQPFQGIGCRAPSPKAVDHPKQGQIAALASSLGIWSESA